MCCFYPQPFSTATLEDSSCGSGLHKRGLVELARAAFRTSNTREKSLCPKKQNMNVHRNSHVQQLKCLCMCMHVHTHIFIRKQKTTIIKFEVVNDDIQKLTSHHFSHGKCTNDDHSVTAEVTTCHYTNM